MRFEFDDEQTMVRDSARRFLADRATVPLKLAAERMTDGFDQDAWAEMVALGWLQSAPARDPADIACLGILAEEIGRTSHASPFLACIHAANLLARMDPGNVMLDALTTGGRMAGVVRPGDSAVPLTLKDGRLSGGPALVAWGCCLDILLVPVVEGQSALVVAVDTGSPGLSRSGVATFDNAQAASIMFSDVTVGQNDRFELSVDSLAQASALHDILLAAEAVGGAFGALDLTVDYVKERRQFGHAIAAFQAVRHGLADVRGLAEGAWLAVWDGLSAATRGDDLTGKAAVAAWAAKRAFQEAALKGSQYHGGMGHVVESHMQFFYRRAGTLHGRLPSEWSLLGRIADTYVVPNLVARETGVVG